MLRSRWLSTFTVIGGILIVLGIVGLILGPHFIYDPGQPVTGKEAWCYLVIGVLMVLNGLLTPALPEEKAKPGTKPPTVSNGTKNGTHPSTNGREVPLPVTDKID